MFYNLPRHMFGKVQSRLFPMFFLWSLVTSAVQVGTFVFQHPMDTWQTAHTVEVNINVLSILHGSSFA